MKAIELIGQVDEQHRLHLELPPDVEPGPVRVVLESLVEDEEHVWRELVSHAWRAELDDPREDIYTLEDGEPENGAG